MPMKTMSLRRLLCGRGASSMSLSALVVLILLLGVILCVNLTEAALSMAEIDEYMAPYVDVHSSMNENWQPESLRLKKWASSLRFGKRAGNGWASQVRFG